MINDSTAENIYRYVRDRAQRIEQKFAFALANNTNHATSFILLLNYSRMKEEMFNLEQVYIYSGTHKNVKYTHEQLREQSLGVQKDLDKIEKTLLGYDTSKGSTKAPRPNLLTEVSLSSRSGRRVWVEDRYGKKIVEAADALAVTERNSVEQRFGL